MRRTSLRFGKGFKVALGNAHSQAATMVIAPGDAEGHAGNKHKGADQWLLIVSGQGRATVNGHRYGLKPSDLLLIERGDRHEIRNDGTKPLVTLNIYVPPAYRADETERPAGKPAESGKPPRRSTK
jgi:mannose-6-phosphate isomerase-like protein (cupin superfamily)